jgi:hypothetical protein
VALIDELNRFRKADDQPLFKPEDRASEEFATYAVGLTLKAYAKAMVLGLNLKLLGDVAELAAAYQSGAVKYVAKNEAALTKALRAYGNSLDLPPAPVIKRVPTWILVVATGGGLLALGSLLAFAKHKSRGRSLPAGE